MERRLFKHHSKKDDEFSIRGHHLSKFSRLERGVKVFDGGTLTLSPAELVNESYWSRRIGVAHGIVTQEYIDDFWGTNLIERWKTKHRYRKLYKKIQRLTDDASVRIVAGVRDTLCNTCPARGMHCTNLMEDKYGPASARRLERDKIGQDIFVNEAVNLGHETRLSYGKTVSDIAEYKGEKTTVVYTTASVVRDVLQKSERLANPIR